ncbi:MAG: hypothetical protein JKY81_05805 [Colwellia sp.]|nr:hypothetical protein [Colwellia sp.]
MAFGYTRTLPTISGTHSDASILLIAGSFPTAAIDGGASSVDNGGGNLRAYTDDTKATQISLQIVDFVTGGSPVIQVWVKIPSAFTGATIYLEADSVASTQPAFGAAFGRNSVWSGYEAVLHLSENVTNGVFVDSTGNGYDTTLTSDTSLSVTTAGHPYGGTWPDFTGSEVLTLTNSAGLVNNTAFCGGYWISVDVASNIDGLFGNRWNSPDNNWVQVQTSLRVITKASTTENTATPAAPSSTTQQGEFCQDTSALTVYKDGSQSAQDTSITDGESIVGANDFRIGTYFDNNVSRRYQGRIGGIKVKRNIGTLGLRTVEYDNQVDAGNWGTSSTWADSGGGGITLSVTLGAIDYASQNTAVQLSGVVDVSATVGLISYAPQNTTVQLSGNVDIIATLGTISYTSQDTNVQLSGAINVSSTLGTIDYSSLNTLVELSGETSVNATLGSIDYSSQNPVVQLSGEIIVNATLGLIDYSSSNTVVGITGGISLTATLGQIDYSSQNTSVTLQGQINIPVTLGQISYNSNNVIIGTGQQQIIGVVTAGFAADLYTSGFKPDSITVTFKT